MQDLEIVGRINSKFYQNISLYDTSTKLCTVIPQRILVEIKP
jgi:hypothetical protein